MKKILLAAFAAAAIIGGFSTVHAQSATQTQQALAHITTALTFGTTSDLQFGSVAAGASTGSVTVAANSTRTSSGTVALVSQGNTPAAASYGVNGEPNYTFNLTVPATDVTITNTTGIGGETMTVNTFTSDIASNHTLSNGGTAAFHVGATLHVSGAQVPGDYAGNFDVTIAYN